MGIQVWTCVLQIKGITMLLLFVDKSAWHISSEGMEIVRPISHCIYVIKLHRKYDQHFK